VTWSFHEVHFENIFSLLMLPKELYRGQCHTALSLKRRVAMLSRCIPCNQAHTLEDANTAFGRGMNQLSELRDAVKVLSKATLKYTQDMLQLESGHKHAMAPRTTFKRFAYNLQQFDKVDFFEHAATRERLRDLARLCKRGKNELQYFTRKVNNTYRGATTSVSPDRDARIRDDISRAGMFGCNLAAECRPLATAVAAHFEEFWLFCKEPAINVPPPVSLLDSVENLENVSQAMR